MAAMTLMINGERRAVAEPTTLADLLEQLGLDPRGVVVEHNRTIVRRPELEKVAVSEGDQVEIVHFVGGG